MFSLDEEDSDAGYEHEEAYLIGPGGDAPGMSGTAQQRRKPKGREDIVLVDKEELERAEKLLQKSALLPEGQKHVPGPPGEKVEAEKVAESQETPMLESGGKGQSESVEGSGPRGSPPPSGSSPPSPPEAAESVSISPSHSPGSSELSPMTSPSTSDPSLLSSTDPSLLSSTSDPSLLSTTTEASSYVSTETSQSQLSQLSSDSDTEAEPFEMVKKEDIQP